MKLITALLSLFLLLSCEDQSLVLSEKTFTQKCTVSGMVYPDSVTRVVDLMTRNRELITSVTVVPGDSMYSFENVEYNSYSVLYSGKGLDSTVQNFYPSRENEWLTTIYMDEEGSNANTVVPKVIYVDPSDTLLSSLYDIDLNGDLFSVEITMNCEMDTTDLLSKITVSPALAIDSIYYYNYSQFSLKLYFPWREFFEEESLVITLDSSFQSAEGVPMDSSFVMSYRIDSLLLPRLTLEEQLYSYSPVYGKEHVDLTTDLLFSFNNAIDFESVEKAFSITPSAVPSFLWTKSYSGYYTLTVSFADNLPSGSEITAVIDTTFRYEDGTKEHEPIVVKFSTEELLLNSYSPLNGEKEVSTTEEWTFDFSTNIDSASIRTALTVVPAIDSFDLAYSDGWYAEELDGISITPYGVQAGTTYAISLDSTVADLHGSTWGRTFTSSFTTKE